MNYILFDDEAWTDLLPLTFTRPVAKIRCGILDLQERWERLLNAECSFLTQPYLRKKFPLRAESVNMLVNGSIFPDIGIYSAILALRSGESLVKDSHIIAKRVAGTEIDNIDLSASDSNHVKQYPGKILKIEKTWDIFRLNGEIITLDYKSLTRGRKSHSLSKSVNVFGSHPVFVEEGARLEYVTLNTNDGPIYIGKKAEIMEGSLIRGPFALGEESVIKMGAKIYGPTTIGPFCKAGGEINNSVLFAYSNKAHDGFLGNSVVGEWCNFGADSNNSNLKNNLSLVRLWDYRTEKFVETDLQFCGLIMGDYSKCGINMMFNTGTVVGVCTNLFGSGFPRNYIPSFSWGGPQGFAIFALDKAYESIDRMMERRGLHLGETDKEILAAIYSHIIEYR